MTASEILSLEILTCPPFVWMTQRQPVWTEKKLADELRSQGYTVVGELNVCVCCALVTIDSAPNASSGQNPFASGGVKHFVPMPPNVFDSRLGGSYVWCGDAGPRKAQ